MAKTASADNNPFFVYAFSFTLPVLLYQLDWSYLYPDLSLKLVAFLVGTFLISLTIGLYIHKKRLLVYHPNFRQLNMKWLLIFITTGNILDFAYQREIPLFSILNKITVENYGTFGIPTFGVFILTFGSFITLYFFYCYLVKREKKYLWACIYLFIFPLLIFSRGAILLNLSNMLFLYFFTTKGNKIKIYSKIVVFLLVVLLGFGYLGNLRTSNQLDKEGELGDVILELGQAKPSFVQSPVPAPFFWSYIYISSPLANLQYCINTTQPVYTVKSFFEYFNYELIFDSISKRIGGIFDLERKPNNLMVPYLTVSTIYASSYTDLGWIGMALTFFALMSVSIIYLVILKPANPFFPLGLAILNTLILFSIFDNMLSFTGLSFQLLYPIILSMRWRSKSKFNAEK